MKSKLFALVLVASMIFGCISVEAGVLNDENINVIESNFVDSLYGEATKVVEIAYGNSEENLRRTEIKEDSEIIVPKSFTVDEIGNFYILDTLNDKVKVFSNSGKYIKSISLPTDMYGLDIEKIGDNIFVYSDNCNLYKIDEQNPKSIELITNISRENIAGIFGVDNELFVRSYNGSDKKITIAEETSVRSNVSGYMISAEDTIIGLNNNSDVQMLRSNRDVTYNLSCSLEPAGAHCLKKEDNTLYTLSNETDWSYTETRASKIEDGLVLETALTISGKAYNYGTPYKKVYVKNDVVYQLVPETDGISIYTIPWTTTMKTRITSDMVEAYNAKKEIGSVATANVASLASFSVTRDEAMDRAYNMCYTGWSYNPTTMHTPTTSTTSSPSHLGSTAKNVAGIPYCWGGMNGLDTATYTGSSAGYLQNFSACLTSGKTAGNATTVTDQWVPGTFGIDCSGFVCAAFKISSKVGTYNLGDYFNLSSWGAVQAGDIAIYPGSHTFMIKYVYTSGSSGIYMVSTYESTIEGTTQGSKVEHRNYSDICDLYDVYTY